MTRASAFLDRNVLVRLAGRSTLATADTALFALAALNRGQTALIHGASGSVGGFAVQLAKRAGARVVATASARSVQRVRDLGADVVVDYKKERFEDHARDVALSSTRLAEPHANVRFPFFGEAARSSRWSRLRRIKSLQLIRASAPCSTRGQPSPERSMDTLALFDSGGLKAPAIGAVFPLNQAAKPHALIESGHIDSRIVLEV